MIFEIMIDNLRDIMDSKKKIFHYDKLSQIAYPELTNRFAKAINNHLFDNLSQASLQIMTRAITDYIIRTLVKVDEATFNQRQEYQLQLTSSLSGFLELVVLVGNDEEILEWLGDEDNWKDCFLIYSDPSLLDADIFWSIVKALYVIEDGIKDRLSLTSESITSAFHHIIICFASLFERQNIDPENIIMLLSHTTISVCYGKGNGKKLLEGWEQKEMFSKFFADELF